MTLDKELSNEEKNAIDKNLTQLGFELIDDKKSRVIEQIKNIIIGLVHHQDNDIKTNLSDRIEQPFLRAKKTLLEFTD